MSRMLRKLERQLDQLEKLIKMSGRENRKISGASVGWHISHSLKVCNKVFEALNASDPKEYRKEFSLPRILVLLSGYIPRGKARAPKLVLPPKEIKEDDLLTDLQVVRNQLRNFNVLPKNSFFEHPYFRKVSKKRTPRFLVVHTRHHLKIIRDILKN